MRLFYRGTYGFLEDFFAQFRPVLAAYWLGLPSSEKERLRVSIIELIQVLARDTQEFLLLTRRYATDDVGYRSVRAAALDLGYPDSQPAHRRLASFLIRLRQHPLARPWIDQTTSELKQRYLEQFPDPPFFLSDREATPDRFAHLAGLPLG